MQTRQLVVMRHAEAQNHGPTDRSRALTSRGLSEAHNVGVWLSEHLREPQLALVSSATRTRQTWAALCEAAGWQLSPEVSDELYSAGPDGVLHWLRAVPDEVERVFVLGHNPTVAFLSHDLADGEGLDEDLEAGGFAPATLVVFEAAASWADWGAAAARVTGYRAGELV